MSNICLWLVSIGVFIFGISIISYSSAPFIVAFVLCYLLSPIVNYISNKLHLKKSYVISLIIISFFVLTFTVLIFIIPKLVNQLAALISIMPEYKNNIQNIILPGLESKLFKIDPQLSVYVKQTFYNLINNIFISVTSIFNNFWDYTKSTISILIMIILVPIISFYLLLNWQYIIESIQSLFPKRYKNVINDLLEKMDLLLSAYIRGQLNICIILACYYSLALNIIGLEFAFLIGLISGFILIMPFVGILIALSSALIVSYLTFDDYTHLSYILGIYLFGHIIEAYFLAPKIIGNNLGLNPVWILFAVLTGASSFGFVGALIAVPTAGILKVIVIFLIQTYKKSKFYN
jgi:putative permease